MHTLAKCTMMPNDPQSLRALQADQAFQTSISISTRRTVASMVYGWPSSATFSSHANCSWQATVFVRACACLCFWTTVSPAAFESCRLNFELRQQWHSFVVLHFQARVRRQWRRWRQLHRRSADLELELVLLAGQKAFLRCVPHGGFPGLGWRILSHCRFSAMSVNTLLKKQHININFCACKNGIG